MAIQLLGFPTTLGLPRVAHRHAPEAMRAAGLVRLIQRLGYAVKDHGDLPLEASRKEDPAEIRVRKTAHAARQQAEHWKKHCGPGDLMMTIGGDHSTSLGTIQALAEMGHRFDVIWVDAHGDFNIIETSPTGNPHGMVLSMASGMLPEYAPHSIEPTQIHIWGIRDVDPGEIVLLREKGVHMADPDQTRRELERLVDGLAPDVFISFDIDSVEPAEAPGTMVPVPNGFHRQEALDIVAAIARKRRVLALDVVEYHPDYDRDLLTHNLAMAVVETTLKAQSEFHALGMASGK